MISHPNRNNPILATVRRTPIGRRHKIKRTEMRHLLFVLSVQQMVELDNGWMDAARGDGDMAEAWAQACRGIVCISVLSPTDFRAGSNPGSIRYDEPGSMHPMSRPTLLFAPAALEEMEYDQIGQLRRKAKRVLVVTD